MRVLALLPDHPDPPTNGSRVRNYYLWPALRRLGVDVKVLGFDQELNPKSSRSFDGEFFKPDRMPLPLHYFDLLFNSFHHRPRSKALISRFWELIRNWKPDIVHAEELRMGAPLLLLPPHYPAKKTCTFYNVETDLLRQTGSYSLKYFYNFFNDQHLQSAIKLEKSIIQKLDLALSYSEIDKKRFLELYPKTKWIATRNGAIASQITPAPQSTSPKVLFVGSLSYLPNITGLNWFIDEVLPLLPAEYQLTVAGSQATAELKKKLNMPRIQFLDTPPELTSIYAQSALSIVPLFQGGGTRTKILESLAHERMVITTPIGAEGLEINPGEGIELTDDPKIFAQKIMHFTDQLNRREQSAKKGRQIVLEKYDWNIVAQELKEEWNKCISQS